MISPVSFSANPVIYKDKAKKSSKDDIALYNVRNFVSDYNLSAVQIPRLLKLPPKQIRAFKNAVKELDKKIYYCAIDKVQHQSGYQIQAFTQGCRDRDFSSTVDFDIKITPKCDTIITRNQTDSDNNVFSRIKNSDSEALLKYKMGRYSYLSEVYEIRPDCIIKAKLSDKLQGFFEVTKYDYKDFSEDINLLEAIKNNDIQGKPISKIIDGKKYTGFFERFEQNGIKTKRSYVESKDKNYRRNEYKIWTKDEELLNFKKTWIKISENETITEINGKTYKAVFRGYSDIEITDNEGNKTVINIKDKFCNFSRDFLTSLDAQTLLNINRYITQVKAEYFSHNKRYQPLSGKIYVDDNISALQHELGHAIDTQTQEENGQELKKREFLEAYFEELENFRSKASSNIYEAFEYFSEISTSLGSNELLAETNLILNAYPDLPNELSSRGYFLVHNFPKTIACAAKFLNFGFDI